MKKIGLLIVMTLTLCLCACGSDSSTTKETGSGDTTAYTYGNVTFEIPTAWGEPTENNDSDEDEIYYFYPEGQKDDSIAPAMLMISVTKGNFSDNMSKKGIYEQLTSESGEGFPADAAKYAIKHVDADWKYNALQKGKSYYNDMSMSKNEVYDQLVSDAGEGFTAKQAQYAVDHLDD